MTSPDPTPDPTPGPTSTASRPTPGVAVALAWLVVALPAAWGVFQTCVKSTALFRGPVAVGPAATRPAP